jgi:preprotein translocase subunit SecG
MFTVITIVHVLACIFLVLVVLLQTGKGAEMGAVFGGSSSTVFGSSGAGTFLTRLTTATAIIFMLTSLSLTYFSSRRNAATVFDTAPAASAPPGAAPEAGEPPAPAAPAPQPEANNAPAQDAAPAAPAAQN